MAWWGGRCVGGWMTSFLASHPRQGRQRLGTSASGGPEPADGRTRAREGLERIWLTPSGGSTQRDFLEQEGEGLDCVVGAFKRSMW